MKRNMMSYYETLVVVILVVLIVHAAWAVDVQMNGDVNVSGGLMATSFTGSGAGLTGITGTNISNSAITVNQLADGAVTANKLLNDAVTPAKIAFLGNVTIVAPSGGDYIDPAIAMADYSTWCPSPSGTNPCLLKIMPGVYTVTSAVQMQHYIDIEGSGENTTIIQGSIDSSSSGVVRGASNAEIRFLTVKNTGGGSYSVAIYNASVSLKLPV